jgi:hypothetical protein
MDIACSHQPYADLMKPGLEPGAWAGLGLVRLGWAWRACGLRAGPAHHYFLPGFDSSSSAISIKLILDRPYPDILLVPIAEGMATRVSLCRKVTNGELKRRPANSPNSTREVQGRYIYQSPTNHDSTAMMRHPL